MAASPKLQIFEGKPARLADIRLRPPEAAEAIARTCTHIVTHIRTNLPKPPSLALRRMRFRPTEKSRFNSVVSEVFRNSEYRYLSVVATFWDQLNVMCKRTETCAQVVAALLPDGERELLAFARAVTEMFGSEQAGQSVEDWLQELQETDRPIGDRPINWRGLTVFAAVRLASRISVDDSISFHHRNLQKGAKHNEYEKLHESAVFAG